MSRINLINVNPELNHILELGESNTRIRHTTHALPMGLIDKIVLFFKVLFLGRCEATDIREFEAYRNAIASEIRWLNKHQNDGSSKFFHRMKRILHVKAKMDYTGWSSSLKEHRDYKVYTAAIANLKAHSMANVDAWVSDPAKRGSAKTKKNICRWIKADDLQLKFAGYSNEIVYKAEEVPVGAVLLNHHEAYIAGNYLRGFKPSFMQRVNGLRDYFCKWFTGMPLVHAVAAIGQGRFLHVAKDNSETGESIGCCNGKPLIEDYSDAKRGKKGTKYMFGYEIMMPNYAKMGKAAGKTAAEMRNIIENDWVATLEGSQKHALTSFFNMVGTICNSSRPDDYDITQVYQDNPETGYSCSGLISAVFARYGVDIAQHNLKRLDKVSPADFALSEMFDIEFSNDRPLLEKLRLATLNK